MKKKIAVLTSGGDAPGMNAAIRACVLACEHFEFEVLGIYHGYNGLINQEFTPLTPTSVRNIIHKGGTLLKSARCPAMLNEQGVKQAVSTLLKEDIDALVVIGGDGSFNGLLAIKEHWHGNVIGIPGTIDNDLDGTDNTIGFATAVNTGIEAIDKIRDTADAFERVFIVELMGRHSGHITFNVGVACGVEKILSFENFSEQVQQQCLTEISKEIIIAKQQRHQSYIIAIAENLWPEGTTKFAEQLSVVTNIDCTPCILGHIQRGGNPVARDRILATKMGVAAIQAIANGGTGIMIGENHEQMVSIPLIDAIQHNKQVSPTLINAQNNLLALNAN